MLAYAGAQLSGARDPRCAAERERRPGSSGAPRNPSAKKVDPRAFGRHELVTATIGAKFPKYQPTAVKAARRKAGGVPIPQCSERPATSESSKMPTSP